MTAWKVGARGRGLVWGEWEDSAGVTWNSGSCYLPDGQGCIGGGWRWQEKGRGLFVCDSGVSSAWGMLSATCL